ncbi:cache domain-containing protein [uncultured Roseobacter sp.]|uniref:cache domain-containing protein n=1 Tax=uncultured Roseobacter sp. TaxID=114847 RepID=UPI002636FD6D|nr:cache domain-containing protein [uncultured Roseobacter sp.]
MLAITIAPFMAAASEQGTAEEATAMLERAVALYEAEGIDALIAAVSDKSNADFHDRDLYVFVSEIDGNFVAHGVNAALVGRDLSGLTDANGNAFIAEMNEVARSSGEGWVDYHWPNPATGNMEAKSTHIMRFGDYYAGVGIYKG